MRYTGPREIVIDGIPAPVPFWPPDRSFAGLVVVLVGGGPSLADLDLALLSGHRFIAINSGCRKVRPIATAGDPLYFSDNSWNANRPELAAGWPGPVITCNRNTKARLGEAVRRIDTGALVAHMGVMPDHAGASSGHVAACLAAVMGASRIVLVGFDGRFVDGSSHGHDDYREQDAAVYAERFVPAWAALAPAFARLGVDLLNATPGSAIRDFPAVTLAAALAP
jgi:hypothetical protein